MRKLLTLMMLGALNLVNAQGYLELNKLLHRMEQENKMNHDTEAYYDLAGKRFIFQKDNEENTERRVLEIGENDEARIIIMKENKATKQQESQIYTGDFIRKKHIVSVRADKLEGERIGVPLTYLYYITVAGGVWYLIEANTNERWIDTNDLGKTPQTLENLSKKQKRLLEKAKKYQQKNRGN